MLLSKHVAVFLMTAITLIAMSGRADAQTQLPQVPRSDEPVVVRVYNVRDLIAPTFEFPISTSTYARSFISPTGQSSTAVYTNPGQGQGGTNALFGGGGGDQKPAPADTKSIVA